MAKKQSDLDLAAALADISNLTAFGDRPVIRTGIEIPNAAGGLQKAMMVDPREFEHGEEAYVVLHVKCHKVRFDEIDPDDDDSDLERVHVLRADEATFIDGEVVKKAVADQTDRIEKAKREASGHRSFDDLEDPPDPIPTPSVGGNHVPPDAPDNIVDASVIETKRAVGTAREQREATALAQGLARPALTIIAENHGVSIKSARNKTEAIDRLVAGADVPKLLEALKAAADTPTEG